MEAVTVTFMWYLGINWKSSASRSYSLIHWHSFRARMWQFLCPRLHFQQERILQLRDTVFSLWRMCVLPCLCLRGDVIYATSSWFQHQRTTLLEWVTLFTCCGSNAYISAWWLLLRFMSLQKASGCSFSSLTVQVWVSHSACTVFTFLPSLADSCYKSTFGPFVFCSVSRLP